MRKRLAASLIRKRSSAQTAEPAYVKVLVSRQNSELGARRGQMSYISKFVTAIVGLLVMALVASRQLFLFALTSERSSLSRAGTTHLWLAAVAGIAACVAAGLMFFFFKSREESKWSGVEMTPLRALVSPIALRPSNLPSPPPFDPVSWALANPWLTEGQADDRIQMNGSVTDSGQTAPGQRQFARRTHQLMFKKWSQANRD
jgi:hypothetical protein